MTDDVEKFVKAINDRYAEYRTLAYTDTMRAVALECQLVEDAAAAAEMLEALHTELEDNYDASLKDALHCFCHDMLVTLDGFAAKAMGNSTQGEGGKDAKENT